MGTSTRINAMASMESLKSSCEKECREIHATWDRLSQLGRALARRTPAERRMIKETYRALFGEDLVGRLAGATDHENEMCRILYAWMLEAHERDAVVAREALGRSSPDYEALVEVYARRKSSALFLIKQVYLARFKRHLDQDIFVSETSHSYREILAALSASHSAHHSETSHHISKCDAKRLYEAVKGSSVTGSIDEPTILEIFSKRSIPQLRLAFSSYKHIYGIDYTKILKKESCGEFGDSLRLVIKCMDQPIKYYTKMLHTSMKGASERSRSTLSRVMMNISEVGVEGVKAEFLKKHGIKLQDAICESIPAGDYRDFLVALID